MKSCYFSLYYAFGNLKIISKDNIMLNNKYNTREAKYVRKLKELLFEIIGDINLDGIVNVQDIILLVNFIFDISNPNEEKKLNNSSYRDMLATSIYYAVLKYQKSFND